jgi:hypothetical protein
MHSFRLGSLRTGLAVLLTLWLAGCLPESKHPVAALDPAQQDPRLWGAWLHVAEDGFSIAHVFATETHGLQIVMIDHDVEGVGGTPESDDIYDAHASRLKSGDYLNVLVKGSETGYLIGKYSFTGTDTMSISFPSEEALKAAVKSGGLDGTIKDEGGNMQDLAITASSKQWQAFLAKAPKDFFSDPVEFQRVGPAFVSE